MIHRLLPLAAVALAVSAAACSSSTSSTSSTTSVVSTTAAKVTTTTAPGPTRCTNSAISVTAGPSSGSAGHANTPVIFTNTSSSPCTIFGYPGVAALDSAGSQTAQATRTGTPQPTHLILTPGNTASALVINTNIPSGNETSCPSWSGLLVTPPNDTKSTKLILQLPGCNGFTVSAVVAGPNGI